VLVRHRPDRREHGDADEEQADRERVGEREAGVGGEGELDQADTTGGPGLDGALECLGHHLVARVLEPLPLAMQQA
jgi:hypothetical protein